MFQKYTHHRWLALPHFLHLRRLPYWFLLSTVLVLGAWIRLLWFGSLQSTFFEGHEANYLIYFEHLDTPNVGDTANYPAMQWWWYLWGFIVPKTETAALLISVCTGLASILVLSESLRRLTQRTWPALMLGVLLCTHPLHVAWSTSIYNVMPPFFFIGLGVYFLVSPKRGGLLSLLSGICLGIAIGMRIEVGIVGLVFVGLCHHLAVPKRQWIGFVLATVFTVFLLIVQTVMVNEIPGSGEHGLALSMNLGLDAYWAPYSGVVLLILLINAHLFETKIRRRHWFSGVLYLLVAHLTLSAFNDFGSRHTLPSLIVLLSMVVLSRPWWIAPGCLLLLHLPALHTVQERFHLEPEDFAIRVSKDYPSLTVVNEYSEPCALVNENEPFAREPVLSHFNLWDQVEFEQLELEFGCVNWCMDWNDWRWSSLGVHDRATRLMHLYQIDPISRLEIDGNECILFRLHR